MADFGNETSSKDFTLSPAPKNPISSTSKTEIIRADSQANVADWIGIPEKNDGNLQRVDGNPVFHSSCNKRPASSWTANKDEQPTRKRSQQIASKPTWWDEDDAEEQQGQSVIRKKLLELLDGPARTFTNIPCKAIVEADGLDEATAASFSVWLFLGQAA